MLIVGAYMRLGQASPSRAVMPRRGRVRAELEFLRDVDHALRGRIFIELHQRRGESRLRLGQTEAGRVDLDLASRPSSGGCATVPTTR